MKLQRTIGILGGGQLARMTIESAMRLGIRCKVLDRSSDAPAAHYTDGFVIGDPRDLDVAMKFASDCDVVTIDSEHVSAEALTRLEAQGKLAAPQGRVLRIIQNKCLQKDFISDHGFPTARYKKIAHIGELKNLPIDFPIVQKKATAGYDGYGVQVITTSQGLSAAFEGESLVEEKINILKELSVIVASDAAGNRVAYDAVEMVFDNERNILKFQLCPADISAAVAEKAQRLALEVAEALQIVGLVAVEMFLTVGDELLINELAPRPHNSGHHTIEAAATSQYENLVRILAGLPLGATTRTQDSLMLNVLGPAEGGMVALENAIEPYFKLPHAHVHLYGKTEIRPFRKLGHITLTGERAALVREFEAMRAGRHP
jgi:5-(carboxyamino)imidazole ribonucleotide synthase